MPLMMVIPILETHMMAYYRRLLQLLIVGYYCSKVNESVGLSLSTTACYKKGTGRLHLVGGVPCLRQGGKDDSGDDSR